MGNKSATTKQAMELTNEMAFAFVFQIVPVDPDLETLLISNGSFTWTFASADMPYKVNSYHNVFPLMA